MDTLRVPNWPGPAAKIRRCRAIPPCRKPRPWNILDTLIQKDLLPILQEETVNGTVQALERPDASDDDSSCPSRRPGSSLAFMSFDVNDPLLDRNIYARAKIRTNLKTSTCAMHVPRCTVLPDRYSWHCIGCRKGGEKYLPSRRRIGTCHMFNLPFTCQATSNEIMQRQVGIAIINGRRIDRRRPRREYASFATVMERRKSFAQLVY